MSKRNIITLVLSAAILSVGQLAAAAEFSGRLLGLNCAHANKFCADDEVDPYVMFEPDFVLTQPNGDYFFLGNVPRDIKVRYVLDDVMVTGKLDERHNSIMVDEFKVNKGGQEKTVWSVEMMRKMSRNAFPILD